MPRKRNTTANAAIGATARYTGGVRGAAVEADITVTLRNTLRDANTHFISSTTSADYIQSDDVHPTYSGPTVSAGLWGGSTGTGAPRYPTITNGRNPIWNTFGHERMGWALSVYNPASP